MIYNMREDIQHIQGFNDFLLEAKKAAGWWKILRKAEGKDVTQEVFDYIKPLFKGNEWANFKKIWDMVEDASHTWLRKRNIPLSIAYAKGDKQGSHMYKRAWYNPTTNTLHVVAPEQEAKGEKEITGEEAMKRYPNAKSEEQAISFWKESNQGAEVNSNKSRELLANDVFAELAHAVQFADYKKGPLAKVRKAIKFVKTDAIPAILTGDSAIKGKGKKFLGKLFPALKYDRYNKPGTTEYTAHKIIEPTLYKAVFPDRRPEWASSYGCPSTAKAAAQLESRNVLEYSDFLIENKNIN